MKIIIFEIQLYWLLFQVYWWVYTQFIAVLFINFIIKSMLRKAHNQPKAGNIAKVKYFLPSSSENRFETAQNE